MERGFMKDFLNTNKIVVTDFNLFDTPSHYMKPESALNDQVYPEEYKAHCWERMLRLNLKSE